MSAPEEQGGESQAGASDSGAEGRPKMEPGKPLKGWRALAASLNPKNTKVGFENEIKKWPTSPPLSIDFPEVGAIGLEFSAAFTLGASYNQKEGELNEKAEVREKIVDALCEKIEKEGLFKTAMGLDIGTWAMSTATIKSGLTIKDGKLEGFEFEWPAPHITVKTSDEGDLSEESR